MSVPKELERLVDRFDPKSTLNETQVRREFIDPFFKALGWDIANEQGAADAYKDVIHEDAIKVGGATKAPDYFFRIGGTRKFFVEAKKPSIDLLNEPSAAYQLRRYAWSAKLPLSILTMKGITNSERYKEKNAHDIYSVLAHYKEGPESCLEEIKPHIGHKLISEGLKGICDKFTDADATGPFGRDIHSTGRSR